MRSRTVPTSSRSGTGRLAGRTAVVTGASRGIGLAIATRLHAEGACVHLVATDPSRLEKAAAGIVASHGTTDGVATHVLDVSDRTACDRTLTEVRYDHGTIDILVNNAALYLARPFTEYTAEDFDRVMQVNLYGPWHLMQQVTEAMKQQGWGRIINIASTSGRWASRDQAAYNVSKHGLVGLTRCVALELASFGVTVNAICPGLVDTDMVNGIVREQVAREDLTPQTARTRIESRIPLGRLLRADEIAALAGYLASDEAAGMTGQAINLDGGTLFI